MFQINDFTKELNSSKDDGTVTLEFQAYYL